VDTPTKPTRTTADLAAITVAFVLPSIITWLYFFQAAGAAKGVQLAVFSVVKTVQFVLPIAWVMLVQKKRICLRPPGGQGVLFGLAFGAVVAGAMAALYFGVLKDSELLAAALPEIRAKIAGFGIDSAWKYAALGVFYSLVHSFMEEYYWRWFVFGQLRSWMPIGAAATISGLGFMAHHVLVLGKYFGFDNPATYLLSSCIAVGGAVWAWLYHRTGSLLGPWVSHLLVDAAIFAIGYDLARSLFAA
jgi:membrane protease YdiL (CAAX protease family)